MDAVEVAQWACGVFIHGALEDTDNQLREPHKLGDGEGPSFLVRGYMAALIVGEVGGFLVVFSGAMLG
jgi:hypothetical protein